LGAGMHPFC